MTCPQGHVGQKQEKILFQYSFHCIELSLLEVLFHQDFFFPPIYVFSWSYHRACGILVPWCGMQTMPLALEVQSLNHWTASEFLCVCVCVCVCCLVAKLYLTFVIPWTVAHQTPLSMGFSRQEYWSGLPCPPPGDLPNPGIKPMSPASPALAGWYFTTESPDKSLVKY